MAVLPKTSCAFAMSGTIKLWKPEDISEHNISFSCGESQISVSSSRHYLQLAELCVLFPRRGHWPLQYPFANNPTLLICYIIVENHLTPNML